VGNQILAYRKENKSCWWSYWYSDSLWLDV